MSTKQEVQSFSQTVSSLFENHNYFIVKNENTAKKECNNIYLHAKVHELLANKNEKMDSKDRVFAAIQKDSEKVRLRFNKRNVNQYKGLPNALEKFKLQSAYYQNPKSNAAYCFDYYVGQDDKVKEEQILQEIDTLLGYFQKIVKVTLKQKREKRG